VSAAAEITASLSSLTPENLQDLAPAERQALSDELRRVYRAIEGDRIIDDARMATARRTLGSEVRRSGVLADLRDGRGRQ
jgi:hypothetical protein